MKSLPKQLNMKMNFTYNYLKNIICNDNLTCEKEFNNCQQQKE